MQRPVEVRVALGTNQKGLRPIKSQTLQAAYTLNSMQFEWDPEKDRQNQAKHGVSFEEASTIFGDPFALTISDPDHSLDENRFLTTGYSVRQRLIIAAHTDRGEAIRLISPRDVSPVERRVYEEEPK